LLESGPRILNAFPDAISTSAASQLRALGVDVRTGVRVVAADAEAYMLDGGERVTAALKVWAAGIRASGSFDESGLELNRAGQVVVGPNLLAKGDQSIFALGDCASLVPDGAERPLPSTAQVANQQAMHLNRYLPAWLRKGDPVPPFRFRDLGALVSLSDYNAFGTLGRFGFFKVASSRAASRISVMPCFTDGTSYRCTAAPRCCGWPNRSTRWCSPTYASAEAGTADRALSTNTCP
jgi:NADH:ubiquinone reductase (H+-translocating)